MKILKFHQNEQRSGNDREARTVQKEDHEIRKFKEFSTKRMSTKHIHAENRNKTVENCMLNGIVLLEYVQPQPNDRD